MPGALYFAFENGAMFIRAEGHITALLCPDLREDASQNFR
jgi:hypothetical protein